MNPLLAAAAEIQQFLQEHDRPFCIIGGLAVVRWGEPRATRDVDVTVFAEVGQETECLNELLARFEARVRDAEQLARDCRVLLIGASNGVPIDLALGASRFEAEVVARASSFHFGEGAQLVTCSAEDLIVFKAIAARDRDWADVEGVLIRQHDQLDWAYITKQLAPLCELKEDPAILDQLEQQRRRVSRPASD